MSDIKPLGSMIDELAVIRDERHVLSDRDKELSAAYEALQAEIIERMDADHQPKSNGMTASASISEQEFASIEDFDAFEAYIYANDALYLMQRRPAQGAVKDLLKAGENVPGIRTFTKRSLNLRKSK